jgi:exonuclease SbcD
MRASFIHVADTHLGNEQYGVRERFNDFSRAFWHIVNEAIARRVDFVVIAGDLFNKRAIDALTLIHAIEGLRRLKDARIPVIAIEGNHDRSYYRDGTSWMQFLCYQDYLILLHPIMKDGVPQITPWEARTMMGAYVDLMHGQLRVYGLPWQGAATVRSIEGMAQALKEVRLEEEASGVIYRLLTMHTGIEGIVPRMQGLPSRASFEPLNGQIDYLALGHVHKPYEYDGWIYNPGSTENCGAEEVLWAERGYYYVQIDTDEPERIIDQSKGERKHHAELLTSQRRPFLRHELRVDGLNEPEELYEKLEKLCQRESARYGQGMLSQGVLNHAPTGEQAPLVLISLSGTMGFDFGALDQQRMEEMVRSHFQPIFVRIDNNTNDQDYAPDDGGLDGRDRSLWHELERRIFEELVGRDARFAPAREQWSTVLSSLKQMALQQDDPTAIAGFLRGQREELLFQ